MKRKYAILDRYNGKIKQIMSNLDKSIESCLEDEEVVEVDEMDTPFAIYWLPKAERNISVRSRSLRIWKLCLDWNGGMYTMRGKKVYTYTF